MSTFALAIEKITVLQKMPEQLSWLEHMTVNHGVLGSSPCSGAQVRGTHKVEVANDKLQWLWPQVGGGTSQTADKQEIRGRASKDVETLKKNLSKNLQIKK